MGNLNVSGQTMHYFSELSPYRDKTNMSKVYLVFVHILIILHIHHVCKQEAFTTATVPQLGGNTLLEGRRAACKEATEC